jgi:[ribosomal protein S18]-alanine N-acetyltransferase
MSAVWKGRASERESYVHLEVRDMRDIELPQVAQIEQAAYEFPWTIGNFRDSLASGYSALSAYWHGELVGYAIIMFALDEAHLLNIAVDPKFQSRGIGRRLLEHVMSLASARRAEILYLEVRPSNSAARQLYESIGDSSRLLPSS